MVKVIRSETGREYPTVSYSFVPVQKPAVTTPESQKTLDEEIKRLSKKYGQDKKLVRKIIDCEGRLYDNGEWEVHQNYDKWMSKDFGPIQINDHWHKEKMDKLGMNIYDWRDSLEYGVMLLKNQGLEPWNASRVCWSK